MTHKILILMLVMSAVASAESENVLLEAPPKPAPQARRTLEGTFVVGEPTRAPDGHFVGGNPIHMPDGSYSGDGTE